MTALTIVIVLILAALAAASTRPGTFHVHRSIHIDAAPDTIFPLISNLRSWNAWSPYDKRDPAMKKTFSGAESGNGAVYEWEGKGHAGIGRIEITESVQPSKVVLHLDMIKPMKGHNVVEFTLVPSNESTKVTWAMQGRNPFFVKVISIFFNLDAMIGKEFETGLASLRETAEEAMRARAVSMAS